MAGKKYLLTDYYRMIQPSNSMGIPFLSKETNYWIDAMTSLWNDSNDHVWMTNSALGYRWWGSCVLIVVQMHNAANKSWFVLKSNRRIHCLSLSIRINAEPLTERYATVRSLIWNSPPATSTFCSPKSFALITSPQLVMNCPVEHATPIVSNKNPTKNFIL